MTTTETQTHTFRASGCINQWRDDHDHAACIDAFYSEKRPGQTCGCPSDCTCRNPFRLTVCGCHQH